MKRETNCDIKIVNEDELVFLQRLLAINDKIKDDEIHIDKRLIKLINRLSANDDEIIPEDTLNYIYTTFFKNETDENNLKHLNKIIALFLYLLKDFRNEFIETKLIKIDTEALTKKIVRFAKEANLNKRSTFFNDNNIAIKSSNELEDIITNIKNINKQIKEINTKNILKIFYQYSNFKLTNNFPNKYTLTYIYLSNIIKNFIENTDFEYLRDKKKKLQITINIDRFYKLKKPDISPNLNCSFNNILLKYICYSSSLKNDIEAFLNDDDDDIGKTITEASNFTKQQLMPNIITYLNEALHDNNFQEELKNNFYNDYDTILKIIDEINFDLLKYDFEDRKFKSTFETQISNIINIQPF